MPTNRPYAYAGEGYTVNMYRGIGYDELYADDGMTLFCQSCGKEQPAPQIQPFMFPIYDKPGTSESDMFNMTNGIMLCRTCWDDYAARTERLVARYGVENVEFVHDRYAGKLERDTWAGRRLHLRRERDRKAL